LHQQKPYAYTLFTTGEHLDGLGTDRLLASPKGRNTIYPASYPNATAVLSMHFIDTPKLLALPCWPPKANSTGRPRSITGTRTPEVRNSTAEDLHGNLHILQTLSENTEAFKALQSMIFLASNHFLDSADLGIRRNIINWLGEEKNAPLLRRLLSVGGPTAESTLEALYPYALHGRSTDVIRIFIDLGCDPNFSYMDRLDSYVSIATTALGSACAGKNLELVCLLLAAGADPNKLSRHGPIHFWDDYDEALRSPIVISLIGRTSRHSNLGSPEEAEDKATLQIVKTLMQSGASVHGLSSEYNVPLAEAVRYGHESVIRFLLDEGANVNLIDGFEKLPLAIAIRRFRNKPAFATSKSLSIIQLLLNAGAHLNSLSTPLHRLR
jgi:hypothetical protein